MKTTVELLENCKKRIKPIWKKTFLATFLLGLLIHLPIMLSDLPNHDGLASMYFDQNMITSGRWFLTIACGFSSYFTIPWVIGILGIFFLSLTAVLLTEVLEVEDSICAILIGGLLVSFPALASTFAYVFTMDGYMLALLLAVFAVYLAGKGKWGWIFGMVSLACSVGTYQAYLAFAMILCMYRLILIAQKEALSMKEKWQQVLRLVLMGGGGLALYYVMLHILLLLEGKQLDTYQGISGLEGGTGIAGMLRSIPAMYRDFFTFTVKSHVLVPNVFAAIAGLFVLIAFVMALLSDGKAGKWLRSIWLYVFIAGFIVCLPLATNVVMLISPEVNYHLIMRYQWALFVILPVAYVGKKPRKPFAGWSILIGALVLIFCYGLADNIGYSNLEKKYEKTYAYCLRLLDRIEQTPGYYQGIPVAMIGVVSDQNYPETDLTASVTGSMIGMPGDMLVYKGADYASFMKNYLGATVNFLPQEAMESIYYTEEYTAMDSFPAATSVQIINGILCVKTENAVR